MRNGKTVTNLKSNGENAAECECGWIEIQVRSKAPVKLTRFFRTSIQTFDGTDPAASPCHGSQNIELWRCANGIFTKDIKAMEELFIQQVQDIYYAEHQLTKTIPKMAEKTAKCRFRDAERLG